MKRAVALMASAGMVWRKERGVRNQLINVLITYDDCIGMLTTGIWLNPTYKQHTYLDFGDGNGYGGYGWVIMSYSIL